MRAHGRSVISSGLGQIPSREEEECVVLGQIAIEDVPILRGDDVETVYPPKLREYGFRERQSFTRSLYGIMARTRKIC
jgi:hypothetical protein